MPDRTVKVTLTAQVAGYIAGMREAEAATAKMARRGADELAKQRAALAKHNAAFEELSRTAGITMLATGAAIGVMVGVAVKKFADFDAEMATVQALTHGTATEMDNLRQAAMSAGQQFGFSATEVATAEEELVKAGISVKDILGGALPAALTIAADGQMDVGDATQIAAEAMTQFQLSGKQLPHVADLLAAGADKALGSVGDLGEALESGGLVAHQFGLSIDGTVGTLAAFAQAGLVGERGGTVLRQMFLKLADPSSEAKKLLDQYNISLYNAQGNFVGIANLAGQLQDKLSGVNQATRNAALSTIFGSRAIQGANVLYQDGAKGIQNWIDKVNDQGFAAQQASDKLDSLEGDLQKLRAAFDTAMISAGSAANGPLRDLTERATDMFNAFSGLPPWLQKTSLGVGAVASAGLALGGAFFLLLPRIVATRAAMDELGISTVVFESRVKAVGAFLGGPWGVAVGATVTGLALLNEAFKNARASADDMENSLSTATGAAQILATAGKGFRWSFPTQNVPKELSDLPATLDAIHKHSTDMWDFFDSSSFGARQAIDGINKSLGTLAATNLPAAQHGFKLLATQTGVTRTQQGQLLDLMPQYRDALVKAATAAGVNVTTGNKFRDSQNLLNFAMGKGVIAAKQKADADGKAAGSAKQNADATEKEAQAAQDAANKLNSLIQALQGLQDGHIDASEAAVAFEQAVDDATAAVKKNGKTLDIDSQKGRDNKQALDGIASSALSLLGAQAKAGASTKDLTGETQKARDSFIQVAEKMGLSAGKAADLADEYGLIPDEVATKISESGYGDTMAKAKSLYDQYGKLRRGVNIPVTVSGVAAAQAQFNALFTKSHAAYPKLGSVIRKADGGVLPGAPSRKDNMLIAAASGEYVVNSAATSRNRRLLDYVNAGGRVPGFADGGQVGPFVPVKPDIGAQIGRALQATVRAPGGGSLINGDVTFQSSGSTQGDLDQLAFFLRSVSRGARRV